MLIRCRHGWPTMTIGLLCSQPALLLMAGVFLCPVGLALGQGGDQSPAQVLQDLLARYGDNSTITVPQLRSLLAALSRGPSDGEEVETTQATPPKTNASKVKTVKCF